MAPLTRSRLRAAAGDPDTAASALASDANSYPATPKTPGGTRRRNRSTTPGPVAAAGAATGTDSAAGSFASSHLAGGTLDDLNRLTYDDDGTGPAAAHDTVHVTARRRLAGAPRLRDEAGSVLLLVLLYMVQGVPLGLTTGALPFMLSSKLSYTQMGIFALASYPYSLKLLWSPIVDSVYSRKLGRRKSWIVPIQLLTAWLLVGSAEWVQALFEAADVWALTGLFLVFVFLMATQDIAVDGWALTLLSPANVSYASTCQTVGQTTGIFTSFTVFLALQDAAFCNKYIRGTQWLGGVRLGGWFGTEPSDVGLVTLAGYMRFWGWVFAAVTVVIALCVRETEEDDARGEDAATAPLSAEDRSILGLDPAPARAASSSTRPPGVLAELREAYLGLWRVAKLHTVWRLTALLLSYRLGVLAAEGAASLKLMDKGVAKEALAFLVLFQFPVELISAVIAGRWAASHSPYSPFITGYGLRILTAAATVAATAMFPAGASSLETHGREFALLAAVSLASSFVSYLSFTSLGSFYNTVSDPAMGGAYLTLLNTIANMGYLLPRTPLFWAMDVLTIPQCTAEDGGAVLPYTCPKKLSDMAKGDSECAANGGECSLAYDGYYIVSIGSLVVGTGLGLVYTRFVKAMMDEPLSAWRAGGPGAGSVEGEAEAAARRKRTD
ncbi:hypothetical protein HYH03_009673 [Edaphochlamys debaryana]|uniref:Acetyl-coenzyme A transporter 1 n=1 Tax=Edaphochlamys debaryana TaxID=47281 RepID=A0A835XXX8_9CHLO|nr:hypothetical protein HYH03_009673 [Edaphochlamys debaryana]|eukprot:KAG2491940.1 hypothetical protein HYH03_009673 [Edaphochlamys debaryana]